MSSPISPEVMAATRRLLDHGGRDDLSLSAIAAEAGVSRVTLHRHGIDVTQVVVALVQAASDDLRQHLWPTLTSPGTAAERLAEGVRVLCDVVERHGAVLSAVYHSPVQPHPSVEGRTLTFDFAEPFERVLLDGGHDGTTRSQAPDRDAEFLVSAVTWTYLHMRRSHGWSVTDAAEACLELCRLYLPPLQAAE
ncbi:MAG: TetR/AcrR family transcriptional regulator [Acidimicrobiales bacterium]